MSPRHQVSRTAIELIKRFEGYRRTSAQLPDGRWTIGYGHTLTAREGVQVSEADAEALLLYDMIGVAHSVSELTYADLTQNQFDALCAFAFSIGLDAYRGSDVLKRVNEGALIQAAFELELWRKAEFEGERIVIDALVRRRAAEKLLFLTPAHEAWRPAPSAVLRPLLDLEAPRTAPRETPAQVIASFDDEAVRLSRIDAEPEPVSPVRAAAEAVSARLETLFAQAEAEAVPTSSRETPDPEAEPPVEVAPEPEPEPVAEVVDEPAPAPEVEAELVEPQDEAEGASEPDAEPAPEDRSPGDRILIDDTAPFEFTPAKVQPLDAQNGDSVLAIVSLVVMGIAFFAGGVFWALNAQPTSQRTVFTPVLVGWLAGVAGVGFTSAAIFLSLQRVTQAAERRDQRLH